MSETEPEPVFTVTFGCSNCGAEWDRDYPPKTTVTDSSAGRRAQISNDGCEEFGVHNCSCCNVIVCPVCDRDVDVYVDDREPIAEGEV